MTTGLVKVCPRCGRRGLVSLDRLSPAGDLFRIDWESDARGKGGARELLVGLGDVLNPDFGCGHDEAAPVKKAATP